MNAKNFLHYEGTIISLSKKTVSRGETLTLNEKALEVKTDSGQTIWVMLGWLDLCWKITEKVIGWKISVKGALINAEQEEVFIRPKDGIIGEGEEKIVLE
jgi:hypothetical protein